MQTSILIFSAVQSAFVVLDLGTLWRDERDPNRPGFLAFCLAHAGTLIFLVATWFAYLLIHAAGTWLLPSLDRTIAFFTEWLGIPHQAAGGPPLSSLGVVAVFAASFLVSGFWDYSIHRFLLHGRRLWILHENHHLPTRIFNGMPGISVRPYVAPATFLTFALTGFCILLCLRALGATRFLPPILAWLPAFVIYLTFLGCVSHSCFLKRFRFVPKVTGSIGAVSPQEHFLHHAIGLAGNYGNFTMIWDKVFRTYLDPARFPSHGLRYGLAYDQDFLGTLTYGKLRIPARFARALKLEEFYNVGEAGAAGNETHARG